MSIAERAVTDRLPALRPPVSPPNPLATLALLPRDLQLYLLSFIDFKNLLTISLLSKSFRRVAEDETTVLGKVKRAFRVFNGKAEVKELFPDQDCRFEYDNKLNKTTCYLIKSENKKTTRAEQVLSMDQSKPFYSVSPTLFVHFCAEKKLRSCRIDYEKMSVNSTEMPAFPSVTQNADEIITDFFQQENFLYLEIRSESAAVSHFLTYVIEETNGPNSFYLGEPMQHIICHWQRKIYDLLDYQEVTSIESIKKEQGQEIIKWSRILSINRLETKKLRGKWLLLEGRSEDNQNVRYHFLDVISGHKMFTYDLFTNGGFFLKDNICVLPDRLIETDIKKSIPLSHRTMEFLNSIVPRYIVEQLNTIEKINWNFTSEKGFFEIEGTRANGQRIQLRFSGNPLIPLLAFSQRPPLYARVFDVLNVVYQVSLVLCLALIIVGAVGAFFAIRNLFKEFQKMGSSSKLKN